ncbi:efflux transporter outer membrane subunit [Collimonas pratensis]|uniref:Efflux transporter, outer membrane factor (OMF) lipo, NodT family protein n=1 Tax=Collimonas pratensis TaxID=279113 RepID=A0A127Q9L2_9BURK|nr:efflux transporter outer membrane subunit [Collimonas pratensis]AMP06760.1 efflux transporter, outer membrane factor (OMF) lipo, NodT family protein [Collimonas pratensis]
MRSTTPSKPYLPSSLLTACSLAVVLSGCADFSGIAPQSRLADGSALAAGSTLSNIGNAAWPSSAWWENYRDPQLNALVQQAVADSPSLKIAQARIRQASSLAGVARAATLPKVGVEASSTRGLYSEEYIFPPPLGGSWNWDNEITVKASYDLDLWDKDRSALESALDTVHVSAAEARSAQLNLETAVVRGYLQLATQFALRDVASATLVQQTSIANIAQRKLNAGLGTRLEVSQAETALPDARSNIEKIDENIALLRNQIAALSGKGPGSGETIRRPVLATALIAPADGSDSSAQLPIALPDNVPAHLVGRRPDVIAQRWRVEAMSKNIDVAKAAFYPDINISAFIGLQALGFTNFLSASSGVRGAGPAISLPIFDGGRLRANLGAQTAALDGAIESYNNTLVQALQSVADQIIKLKSEQQQRGQSEQALALSKKSYDLAKRGYQAGLTANINVIQTQLVLLQQQLRVAQIRAGYLDSWAQLMQALGGGLGDDLPQPLPQPGASGDAIAAGNAGK